MKIWSFYDPATGLFAGLEYVGTPDTLELNTPDGHAHVEGRHDHLSRRVDLATGEVVDHQPPQPSADHEWDGDRKRWRLTEEATERARLRARGLVRMDEIDRQTVQALRELRIDSTNTAAAARLQELDLEAMRLIAVINGTAPAAAPKSSGQ